MARTIVTKRGKRMVIPASHKGTVVQDSTLSRLVAEIETKARELQGLNEECDSVKRNRNRIAAGHVLLQKENERLEKLNQLALGEYDASAQKIVKSMSDAENLKKVLEDKTLSYQKTLSDLEDEISRKYALRADVDKYQRELTTTQTTLFEVRGEIQKMVELSSKLEAEMVERKDALTNKEKEVKELIEKYGQISTENERKLRLIEFYVKRLQRIYDKSGIKINLLPQFNIVRDPNEKTEVEELISSKLITKL